MEWVPIPSPGDLPDPGIEPGSPTLQADSLPTESEGSLDGRNIDSQKMHNMCSIKDMNRGLLLSA